jgi:hypothetical protein
MKNWEISKTTYKVGDFISWQRSSTLELSPSFQRRPVWQAPAKSYLLDTIVRGLPMPIIFLREKKSDLSKLLPTREVVDGQQRIRTIFSFIDPSLLKDYKSQRDDFVILKTHNLDLAGKKFDELDADFRQAILDYSFSVHIFPVQTDDREILEIFARMNSTGVKLNDQELRNATYFGKFKTSMYCLASEQLERWRSWKIFTEYNIARMDEVELTSEFASLILKGLTGKSQASINKFYRENDIDYPNQIEIENRFRTVMDTIDKMYGSDMRILPFRKETMFFHLFLIVYHILYGLNSSIISKRPNILTNEQKVKIIDIATRIERKEAPEDVVQSVARRTTNPNSRKSVFNYYCTEVQLA